ncbi:MAG: glycosyltransferase family 39 protein, partial [Pirellulaceae bacterium]|nr:glycosyltransferase family 39 protein [Pirellulaceae bacterium]
VGPPVGDGRSEAHLVPGLLSQLTWDQIWWYFFLGRVLLFPFSIASMYIAQRWAIELTGKMLPGSIVSLLWTFSPITITNGAMLTPDMGATFFGLLFTYFLWRVNRTDPPNFRQSLLLGVVLGLAILSKFSLLALYPVTTLYFVANSVRDRRYLGSLVLVIVTSIGIINLLYFDFIPCNLESLPLVSETFGKLKSIGFINCIPICFPDEMMLGIDRQKLDFETRFWSFFCGNWRKGGWYEFYAVGLLVKTPIVAISLFAFGVPVLLRNCLFNRFVFLQRTFFCLVFIPFVFFMFISSQIGFSHHLRYVLPIYPFLVITAGCGGVAFQELIYLIREKWTRQLTACVLGSLMLFNATETVMIIPHTQTYFNQIAGGPNNGHWYLINSDVDWGQDVYFLKEWLKRNDDKEVRGIALAVLFGNLIVQTNAMPKRLESGYYIISVDRLHDRDGKFQQFVFMEPCETIGGALRVYYLKPSLASPKKGKINEMHETVPQLKALDL